MNGDRFTDDVRPTTAFRIVKEDTPGSPGVPRDTALRPPDVMAPAPDTLFVGGPPGGLERRLGLLELSRGNTAGRALMAVGFCWLPLFAMTAGQDLAVHDGSFLSFLADCGVHARYLIALPVLILADALCSPGLGRLIWQIRTNVTSPQDIPYLDRAILSMVALRDSIKLEAAVIVGAFVLVAILLYELPSSAIPAWNIFTGGVFLSYTLAGLWQALISTPVLIVVAVGWLWRLALWTRLLHTIARMHLHLIASHPDKCGGIRFLGLSLQAYASVVFGYGAIIAGTMANRIMHDGMHFLDFRYLIAGFIVLTLALFAGPLLAFLPRLISTRTQGILNYGGLAQGVGAQLEGTWLKRGATGTNALDVPHFSATTDLYSVVANTYAMTVVPLSLTDIVTFVVAALLPFLPVLLMSAPIDLILREVIGLFATLPGPNG